MPDVTKKFDAVITFDVKDDKGGKFASTVQTYHNLSYASLLLVEDALIGALKQLSDAGKALVSK